jgi:hypothetical protein
MLRPGIRGSHEGFMNAFEEAGILDNVDSTLVIAVDVNENVIVYGNDDFIERFETNEGILRTRYFLKRRRIESKIRGRELQARLLGKYRGRGWRRVKEIYYRAARGIIGKALEVGGHRDRDGGSRGL